MDRITKMFRALSPRERTTVLIAAAVLVLALAARLALAVATHSVWVPVSAGSFYEGVVGQPVAINPILSANTADQDLSMFIYSRLTELATTIEADSQFQTFTVKLAEELTWDDGMPLTSDDVVFTIKTIQDPDAHSPLAASWQGVVAERVSELQITFTLPSPYAFFEETLARLPVIPQHIFGTVPPANLRLSSYNLEPVGSGPYRVDGYDAQRDGFITEYRLVPNERYHGTQSFIRHFTFRFYPDNETLKEAFRVRRVDGFGLSLPPSSGVPNFNATVIERVPMPRYYAVFLNQLAKPALRDGNFRKALSEAVDRERLVNEAFGSEGTPVVSPYPLTQETDAISANPAAAREHVASVKAEERGLTLVVPRIPALEKVAELLKNDWDAVGIAPVTVVSAPTEELAETVVQSRNYELLLLGNTLENPQDLYPFWHSAERLSPGLNFSLYQNTEVDQRLELVRQTEDPEERTRNLNRITTLIAEDNPAIFLFSLPYLYLHREHLKGFDAELIVTPADRFRNVAEWSVAQVRVLK